MPARPTERTYFDWNATAPLNKQAQDAVLGALQLTGNPSSVHAEGRAVRRLVEEAREQVAALVGAQASNVTFTSGATEANMLALTPAIEVGGRKEPRDRLFISAIEHPSVRSGGRFAAGAIEELPVTSNGVVDLAALARALGHAERPLVSVMLANNETGVIQPIANIAEIVHAASGILHVDAVQGPGRMDCNVATLGADLLSISSHKIGGPQGAGALILRKDVPFAPLYLGGEQEQGRRAGTENLAAIAGFGAAAEAVRPEVPASARLRDLFEARLKRTDPSSVIFGGKAERLPNTSNFALPGIAAETSLIALDLDGVMMSSGAACSSGKVKPSHVLAAMGISNDLARCALRASFGRDSTEADVDAAIGSITNLLARVRSRAAA